MKVFAIVKKDGQVVMMNSIKSMSFHDGILTIIGSDTFVVDGWEGEQEIVVSEWIASIQSMKMVDRKEK